MIDGLPIFSRFVLRVHVHKYYKPGKSIHLVLYPNLKEMGGECGGLIKYLAKKMLSYLKSLLMD